MAVVSVGKFFFLVGNPCLSISFFGVVVNFIVEKKGKNVCYDQVKLSSAQSFSLWQLLMLASFIFFVAGSPYFNQVDFWRSEFDR